MNDDTDAKELEAIRQCRSGSRDHYALLVNRYKDMAYSIACRMVGDEDTARDMAQESFIAAYGALKDFRMGSKFSTWLVRIVLNKCKDHLKSRRDSLPVDEIRETAPAREQTPEQAMASRQTGDLVQKALDRLPEEYRTVIVLKHIEEMEYGEISDILGVSVNALKVRACRGREMLKQHLQGAGVRA